MYLTGFTGDDAPRAVLLFLVVRLKMLCIMASMTQKDCCLEEYLKFGVFLGSYVICFRIQIFLVRQWIHVYVSLQRPGVSRIA